MKLKLTLVAVLMLSACTDVSKDGTAETIYKVQPGHWTGESATQYSANKTATAPYIHDWCLTPEQITISATELADALAGFVAENHGECRVTDMDDGTYKLRFGVSCNLDDVPMTGSGLMTYAKDGKTTDMTLELKSVAAQPEVTFSRIAHQKWLSETCPPQVDNAEG